MPNPKERGHPPYNSILTPREWKVLALVRASLTNRQIGQRLEISSDGVKYHVSNKLGKLYLSDRTELARWNRTGRSTTIMMLGKDAFQRSKQFVEAQARHLDVAHMQFHLDSAPAETLVKELESFQNDDGGFASAMAPDLSDRESSPLGTSIAFQYMREVGQAHFEGIASKSARYLTDTFDEGSGVWRIIPDSVEDTPHPPWFNRSGLEQEFGSFKLNPTAEILGYL